jgi:hypothetical protein
MHLYTYVAFGFRMLKTNMWPVYKKNLAGPDLVKATTAAYLELDQLSLVRSSSFLLVAMFLKLGAVLTAFF